MDFAELKNKSAKELAEILEEKRGKLRDLNFQVGAGELKNVRVIRKIRKEIAMILTVLNKPAAQSK